MTTTGKLAEARTALDRVLADCSWADRTVLTETKALEGCLTELEHSLAAQTLLQEAAELVQNRAAEGIARVVSKCLSAVFAEPYEFRVLFVKSRGRTEARLVYYKDNHELDPRLTSGGVLDLAVLAMRLARLSLTLPPTDKTLILDEPFRGVYAENLTRVGLLIETLARETGVQFLFVTHEERLRVGKVVRFG